MTTNGEKRIFFPIAFILEICRQQSLGSPVTATYCDQTTHISNDEIKLPTDLTSIYASGRPGLLIRETCKENCCIQNHAPPEVETRTIGSDPRFTKAKVQSKHNSGIVRTELTNYETIRRTLSM
ncbi:hypothetical protein EVAR_4992_1 [Eumeta japonica]|uniref:Uncharacterized protein n=1 Tax=Eumeta variegata TaxID=151549 RepID=A0A4C1UZ26_EUMVA|nr:hypothetical protein EVAR_4992_1 [Eumeta japonica]